MTARIIISAVMREALAAIVTVKVLAKYRVPVVTWGRTSVVSGLLAA